MESYFFRTVLGMAEFDPSLKLKCIKKGWDAGGEDRAMREIREKDIPAGMHELRKRVRIADYRQTSIRLAKKKIRESVGKDNLIVQAINNIEDINKAANLLAKRLREWYELHNPEFSKSISGHEKFVELVMVKDRKALLGELGKEEEESMGAELSEGDIAQIRELAETIKGLYRLRDSHEKYIEGILKGYAPNLLAMAGPAIAAKLIEHIGSLKRLVSVPASTIQLLGAEKALFRHIVTGAKCPKFGVLYNHPLVSASKNKGKAARLLADKISIAAKMDYFKGEFIGDRLRKEVEGKLALDEK